jgi:hypothetical protein
MYKIIGADQKEYGPVAADQLRQWIVEGRVNANTLVQAEGQTGWQPLSTVPELASALPLSAPLPGTAGFNMPNVDSIRRKVAAPAICLMIVGILTLLLSIANVVMYFAGGEPEKTGNEMVDRIFEGSHKPSALVFNVVQLICGGVMIMAGLKMKNLQSHKTAMTASVFAMIPCTAACCCIVGLPVGIWCLIVLNQPDVKAAFD